MLEILASNKHIAGPRQTVRLRLFFFFLVYQEQYTLKHSFMSLLELLKFVFHLCKSVQFIENIFLRNLCTFIRNEVAMHSLNPFVIKCTRLLCMHLYECVHMKVPKLKSKKDDFFCSCWMDIELLYSHSINPFVIEISWILYMRSYRCVQRKAPKLKSTWRAFLWESLRIVSL